jgi:hypothetical protein
MLPRSTDVNRLVVASAIALFLPLVALLLSNRVFAFDDLSAFHVPTRYLYANALRAGDSLWWTPHLMSGFYLHGEGQIGMLHPLHLALYSALPFVAAFNLDIMASYAFALAGGVVMLRRFGMSPTACWLGGLLFAFSGFNLMHLLHINAVAVAAHLPWLMVSADRVLTARTARDCAVGAIGLALVVASALLMGFPQCLLLSGIAVAAYVVWRLVRPRVEVETPMRTGPRLAWLIGACLAGVGLGAVQILPMLDVASESFRRDVSLAFSTSYSLHPYNLIQLLTPYAMRSRAFVTADEPMIHESAIYGSAFGTLAIVWALLRGRDMAHRPIVAWALMLCGVSLVLALGRYGGLYYLLASLPVFQSFRAPARFILLLHFGISIVGAAVFDDLAALARARQRPSRVVVGGLAGVIAASAVIALAGYLLTGRRIVRGAESVALVLGTALLMILAARGRRLATGVLAALVALDLGLWGYRYTAAYPVLSLAEITAAADVPPGSPGELLSAPKSNAPVLRGYRVINGYVALLPDRALDIEDATAQRLAGAAWREDNGRWTRVPAPMPRARILFDWRQSDDVRRDLVAIDVTRTVLVDVRLPLETRDAHGTADIVEDRPGRIVVDVNAPAKGLLVTTERFHAGWQAVSERQRLATVRVNGDFLACLVEPGDSRVTLTFAPRSLRTGAWVSVATLALLACAAFMTGRRRRSERSS